jgi:glycogen synthase
MRILISSHFFYPSVGGIEQVSLALATQFAALGHAVKIVTMTRESDEAVFPFQIIRCPSALRLLKLVHWAEVVFHNNISVRTWWPLVLIHRPWVIAHHTWIARTDSSVGLRDRFKHFLTRFAINVAISKPVADHLNVPSIIIGDPYRDELFRRNQLAKRDNDLIFVGRLVSDKGVDTLLGALKHLRERRLFPKVTIAGDGPDLDLLRRMVEESGLGEQVTFAGIQTGQGLVELLNRHWTIVVPSRWQEPFGLVVLEAIGCGCRAIVAASGGLMEAAGPFAIVFERENVRALAEAIERALTEKFDWEKYWRATEEHLEPHRASEVARRYLEVFEKTSSTEGRKRN